MSVHLFSKTRISCAENNIKEKLLRNLKLISCLIHLHWRKKCSRTVTLHVLSQTCGFNIQASCLLNIPKDHESLLICKIKIQLTLLLYVLLSYSLKFVSFFFTPLWQKVAEMCQNHVHLKNIKPTRCHLLFYCTSNRLNLFRALLCPSSGARNYDVDYHIGRIVLGLLYVGGKVQLGWSGVRLASSRTRAWACNLDTTPA